MICKSSYQLAEEPTHFFNGNQAFRQSQTATDFGLLRLGKLQLRLILLNQSQQHFAHFTLAIMRQSLRLFKGTFEKLVHSVNITHHAKCRNKLAGFAILDAIMRSIRYQCAAPKFQRTNIGVPNVSQAMSNRKTGEFKIGNFPQT
jgi:hypothetical protein